MLKWHLTIAKCIVRYFNQYVPFYLIIIGVRLFGQDTAFLRIYYISKDYVHISAPFLKYQQPLRSFPCSHQTYR